MPAFALIPIGGIATVFSFGRYTQQIRKRESSSSWVFRPAAILFAIVLVGTLAFIALLIYFTAFHRR